MHINWKKIGLYFIDAVLAVYLIAAFTVLNKTDEIGSLCERIKINIADKEQNGFITKEDISNRLDKAGFTMIAKPMNKIVTRQIEDMLRKSPFVETAECYKQQDGSVTIDITQRMPVLRIKSVNGDDYYLDDNNQVMPNSNYTSDLPIATGYISRYFAQNYIATLATSICNMDLWQDQIEQINVLPDQSIELIPRVGDHIIFLGKLPESKNSAERKKLIEEFTQRKLNRLEKFYRYGLSLAGWNKYSVINIEFDNQIICKKTNQ